jgi:hypothetical protein
MPEIFAVRTSRDAVTEVQSEAIKGPVWVPAKLDEVGR